MRYLILAFIVVPLLELYLLLWVSRLVGFWPTVALTVVTGVLGGTLSKREGLRVVRQWSRAMDELRMPETGLIEAALVLTGGALLITPGVVTDLVGLSLLIPPTRRPIARWLRARVSRYIEVRSVARHGRGPDASQAAAHSESVIDTTGEAQDEP